MGVYLPQWAKEAKTGDSFKYKDNPETILVVHSKVGPLQGYSKHGFKTSQGGMSYYTWEQVEPLNGIIIPEAPKQDTEPKKRRAPGTNGVLEAFLEGYIKDTLQKYEDALLGDFTKTLKLEVNGKAMGEVKTPHFMFGKLMTLIASRQDAYLWGPAGTGKSTAAHQVATALELPFYYVSLCPQSSETLLFGFNHAGGGYVETDFYRCYRDGGVFCLDEMDNGSAALLNKLNSLLENGHGSFPCGMVKRHEKFILVSTGNTNGNGASLEFPDRRAFDPAFKERFCFLNWPLDEDQEKLIAFSISKDYSVTWLDIVKKVRAAVKSLNLERVLVTPRATFKGLKLLEAGFKEPEVLDMVIFKGCGEDVIASIRKEAKIS